MLRPLRPAPTAPRTIQQTPQFPTYALRAQQKDGVARDYGRPSPCLSGAPPNREQIFLSHFPAPGERTAKHASLTDQAPAPPEVHQATNNRFSPFPPRISVRSLTGRSAGLRRSISPPCFGLRQSTLQPFSCHERNTLFRNPVQHQDGCRRRLSNRQTRRPKPARSFWCLFLKKARLFVTETLVRAPRAIKQMPRYTLPASHAPRTLRRSLHAPAFPRPALCTIQRSLHAPAPNKRPSKRDLPTAIERPFSKRLSTPAASSVSFLKKYRGFDTMYLTPEWYCRRTAAGARPRRHCPGRGAYEKSRFV